MYLARQSAAILPKCPLLAACASALLPAAADKPHPSAHPRPCCYSSTTSAPTSDDDAWPGHKPLSHLTPYEIFNQPKSSTYRKATFYRLVKLYHPDILPPASHPSARLSKATRTERFRLIVAANALLADPARKRAYDVHGIGWGTGNRWTDTHTPPHMRRSTADVYASGPWKRSPAGNATWEDWERWYRDEGMHTQSRGEDAADAAAAKTITTHSNFITVLLLLSFVGVAVQLIRADSYNSNFVERRDRRHREISSDLFRARRFGEAAAGKDERVQAFLRMRDPEGYGGGVEAVREERMRQLLPEGEVCLSGDLVGKDVD
ncbi:J domain-containing protein 1 [Orbilia brochopaga]|uniref:J domain-containing protein 1 n=1 Tax=Orbilia brochopaga TaxID=3140254 RepID=A0AAV9UY72_9PEZI